MKWLLYGLFLVFVFSTARGSGGGGCLDRPQPDQNDNMPDVNINENVGGLNDNVGVNDNAMEVNDNDGPDLNDNDAVINDNVVGVNDNQMDVEALIELEVIPPGNENDNLNENQNSSTNGNDNIAPECTSNGDCDDGLFCTGEEICAGGECIEGFAIHCPFGGICDEAVQGCLNGVEPPSSFCPPLGPLGPPENDLGEVAPGSTIALGTDCDPTAWSALLDGVETQTRSVCCWRFFIEVPMVVSEGDHLLEIRAPGMDEPVTTLRFSQSAN